MEREEKYYYSHPTIDRSLSRSPYPLAPGAQVAEAVAGASPDYSLMPIHPAKLGSPSSLDIHNSQRLPCIILPCIVSLSFTEYHKNS